MKRNLILINLLLILINFSIIIDSIDSELGVPVLLWSQTDNHLINNNIYDSINSESSVNRINYNVLRDDYLLKSKTIVVFLQKDLSIEQFSTEDKKKFNTIKNIINDRSLEPLLLTDVLNPTKAIENFIPQDINQININNGNKIVINLPKNSLVENDRLIGQLISRISQNVTGKVLYLITGRQNSNFDDSDNEIKKSEDSHHYSRHILAENYYRLSKRSKVNNRRDDLKRVITVGKNCLFLFTTVLTVSHYNYTILNTIDSYDTLINKPVVNKVSQCWQINAKKSIQTKEAIVNFTFRNNSEIQIQFTIDSPHYRNRTDFWRIKRGFVILTEKMTKKPIQYELIVDDIKSENQFSYSCSKLMILSQIRNKTDGSGDLTQISLVFNNFQLQPFENPHNSAKSDDKKNRYYIFTDSFDCETWMTLPLWMGLITLFMFIITIYIGVYFLSHVNTPDRFENPKGKPLMISNFDE